jgi:uncharacterized protein YcbX
MTSLGSLASLHRYPVKSMMGEELNAAYLTSRGLFGDRAYALRDTETGGMPVGCWGSGAGHNAIPRFKGSTKRH